MTNLNLCDKSKFRQCYKSWKTSDYTIHSVIPSNSHPNSNVNSNLPREATFICQRRPIASKNNMKAAANPMKHWRQQLAPNQGNNSSKRVSIRRTMDTPGGTINRTTTHDCSANGFNSVRTYIDYMKVDIRDPSRHCVSDPANPDSRLVLNTCARKNIVRRASTIISKNYYTTTKAYLQSRVKLYDQRQSFHKIANDNGSQSFNSTSCYHNENCSDISNGFIRIIYKPNNANFSQQGAVSGSLRTTKLKVDTINTNAAMLKNVWGQQAANAARYRGNSETPFLNKSIHQNVDCSADTKRTNRGNSRLQPTGGLGNRTVCPSNELLYLQNNHLNNKMKNSTPSRSTYVTSKPMSCREAVVSVRHSNTQVC